MQGTRYSSEWTVARAGTQVLLQIELELIGLSASRVHVKAGRMGVGSTGLRFSALDKCDLIQEPPIYALSPYAPSSSTLMVPIVKRKNVYLFLAAIHKELCC